MGYDDVQPEKARSDQKLDPDKAFDQQFDAIQVDEPVPTHSRSTSSSVRAQNKEESRERKDGPSSNGPALGKASIAKNSRSRQSANEPYHELPEVAGAEGATGNGVLPVHER